MSSISVRPTEGLSRIAHATARFSSTTGDGSARARPSNRPTICAQSVAAALGVSAPSAAFAGTRLLTSMLFQVKPNDPGVYLAVVVLLGIVALVASYVP